MNGAALALAVVLGALAQDKQNPAPIPGWDPDLQSGFAEAARTGRPLMIVFR